MTLLLNLKTEKRKCMTLSSKLRRDITLLIKNSLELTSSIGFGHSLKKRVVMMRTQDLWRPRKITSSSSLKSLRIKLFKLKNNGSKTRLILLRNKTLTWGKPQCVKSLEPRSLSLSKRNWELTPRFNLTRKRLGNLKLQRITLILKWISWMTCSTRTLIFKRNSRMITLTLRMSSNKSWRSLKINQLDSRTALLLSRNQRLISWLRL